MLINCLLSLRTPLMLSVLSGHTDCVYSLLNKGASVEAKDKWGRTALHRGVSRCYHFTFQLTLPEVSLNNWIYWLWWNKCISAKLCHFSKEISTLKYYVLTFQFFFFLSLCGFCLYWQNICWNFNSLLQVLQCYFEGKLSDDDIHATVWS